MNEELRDMLRAAIVLYDAGMISADQVAEAGLALVLREEAHAACCR